MMKSILFAALAVLLLAAAPAARAQILFAGGEDTEFSGVTSSKRGSAGGETDGGYRSSFAREGLNVDGNGSTVADPPTYMITSPTFTATSNPLWIHAQVYMANVGSTAGIQAVRVYSPDGVARILLRQTATEGLLKVSTRNAAGTITDLATASSAISANTQTALDLMINYTCSSSGGVQLYVAGVQVINYSGNPCTDSATTLNQVALAQLTNDGNSNGCTNGTQAGNCWSEVIAAQQDTRSMGLWSLTPQATGNTQSWTGSVGNINETTINDSNNINTATNNALSEWTTPTSYPSGNWSLTAVVQSFRALVGTTGPQHFQPLMRVNSTDNTSGTNIAPTTSFANYQYVWTQNPHTSAAFSTTDISSGFNLGLESEP